MEINTSKAHSEPDSPAVVVPPDRGRSARKKTAQNFQRTRHVPARLLAVLKLLGVTGVVVLAAVAAFYAYRHACTADMLTLRHITFAGCRRLDPGNLEMIVQRNFPANILRIDLDKLRSRLEQETWIRRAEIRRVLPASLEVYVEERVPSAIAEIGGELELLDNEGVLLDRYDPSYGKLDVPVFTGLRGDSAAAYKALQEENSSRVRLGVQLLTELASGSSDLTRDISEIDLSDPGNVKVLLVNDTAEIYLGDRDFLKRFQAFLAQYEQVKSEYGEMASVNLRFFPDIVYSPKRPPGTKAEAETKNRQPNRN
jgi:cell division protein FtsQ